MPRRSALIRITKSALTQIARDDKARRRAHAIVTAYVAAHPMPPAAANQLLADVSRALRTLQDGDAFEGKPLLPPSRYLM